MFSIVKDFFSAAFRLSAVVNTLFFVVGANAHPWQFDIYSNFGGVTGSMSQNITLAPGLINNYATNGATNTIWGVGAGVNYSIPIKTKFHLTAGMRGEYFETSNQFVSGVVHPLVNVAENFDELNYNYKMKNYLFLSNFQWLWDATTRYHPYVNMGLGVVWNTLYSYTETAPSGSTAVPMLYPFHESCQAQFAYGFGIGLDTVLKKPLGMQIGYEFLALGRGQLGTTSVQSSSDVLSTKNIYLNLLDINFYFTS